MSRIKFEWNSDVVIMEVYQFKIPGMHKSWTKQRERLPQENGLHLKPPSFSYVHVIHSFRASGTLAGAFCKSRVLVFFLTDLCCQMYAQTAWRVNRCHIYKCFERIRRALKLPPRQQTPNCFPYSLWVRERLRYPFYVAKKNF